MQKLIQLKPSTPEVRSYLADGGWGFINLNNPVPRKALKPWLRKLVFKRDLFTCQCCGASPFTIPINYTGETTLMCADKKRWLEIDHKHPYSLGGECSEKNLQTMCNVCNCKKSNKVL